MTNPTAPRVTDSFPADGGAVGTDSAKFGRKMQSAADR